MGLRVVVAGLAACTGCAQLFNLEPLPDAAAGSGAMDGSTSTGACLTEDFDNNTWGMGWTPFGEDRGVSLAISSGQLVLAVPEVLSGSNVSPYGGLTSETRDMTGVTIEVEFVKVPGPGSPTEMALQFAVGNDQYAISYEKGQLYMRTDMAGGRVEANIPYNATTHRFVSVGHDPQTGELVFRARPAGGTWTELQRMSMTASLAGAYVEIYGGTYDPAPAVSMTFDNLVVSGACPN